MDRFLGADMKFLSYPHWVRSVLTFCDEAERAATVSLNPLVNRDSEANRFSSLVLKPLLFTRRRPPTPPNSPGELKDARCCMKSCRRGIRAAQSCSRPLSRGAGRNRNGLGSRNSKHSAFPQRSLHVEETPQTALPATCSVLPPGRGQERPGELRGGRTLEANSNFAESERYSRKTHGGRGLRAEK